MMGTLKERQKSDRKTFVPSLIHAYNTTMHEGTGYSPLYLMFGCHSCLAINAFLWISSSEEHKAHQDYVDWLKDRLQYVYEKAEIEARERNKYKKNYDQKTRTSLLMPGAEIWCSRKTQDM